MTVSTHHALKATSADRRKHRQSESGQVLVLFLLIFTTMMLIATVAVVVGQVLVRRQQAQMVVDAAAFAGASKQAEGLNTIANLNHRSLEFLRMIQWSNLAPRFDSAKTSFARAQGGQLAPFSMDWAGDLLESYQGVFDFYMGAINVANCAYSPLVLPHLAARDVVNMNFESGSVSIFTEEDKEGFTSHGPLVWDTILVKLSEPEEYDIPPHWYLPNLISGPGSVSTCASFPAGTILCIETYLVYAAMDIALAAIRLAEPIEYSMGRFYDNEEGTDVRFAYFLEVSQSPVIFGRQFFDDIPRIVVAAAAKPYGGYLGNTFEKGGVAGDPYAPAYPQPTQEQCDADDEASEACENLEESGGTSVGGGGGFVHGSADGEEIKPTYKAKLVPLTNGELLKLALVIEGKNTIPIFEGRPSVLENPLRWNPLTNLH